MAKSIKLKVKGGDPVVKDEAYITKGRTPIDDTADVRDIMSGLVGKGITNLADETARSGYARLQVLVGPAQAQKLMNHMFIFNSRPDLKNAPVESKIKQFYETPSADPEVTGTLGKVKSFGYGVLPGFRDSSSQLNQQLSGKTSTDVAIAAPEQTKALKLKIAGKL